MTPEEAAEAVIRVRAVHRPASHARAVREGGVLQWVRICLGCREQMPCRTIRALDGPR